MMKQLFAVLFLPMLLSGLLLAQNNEWGTDYVTFDNALNGPGYQVSSVATIGPDRFIGLVAQTPASPILDNLFNTPGNYLVGYWDADSGAGRVDSPINGSPAQPRYGFDNQFTDWESGLDLIRLDGAWQLASDNNGRVYVANNDADHNILVFQLDATGVTATDFRMITGTENIFAIEVDDNGFVYVADYKGDDVKTNEVRVYAGIGAAGTTWGDFGGHNDAPVTTIDLPVGTYYGLTTNSDGSELYISASDNRQLWKYTGSPAGGYTLDGSFNVELSPADTVSNGGSGTPSFLGLAYLNNPPRVFAAIDTFIRIGDSGGYPYARIYSYDNAGNPEDTLDIAEWNLAVTGDYSSGSNDGRAGGFGSVVDLDIEETDPTFGYAIYTQSYYGWAVEKWASLATSIRQIDPVIPGEFNLAQNYPNPFNPSTTIEFSVQRAGLVTLSIYNISGQLVATLLNERVGAGTYSADFDATNLPSGVYFYQLKSDSFSAVKKMILAR